jgi:hypothetical protein
MQQIAIHIATILIRHPWSALLVAGGCVALWWWSRSKVAFAAAIAWAGYAGYEYLMFARILCTGDCNIRVDILFVYPLLLLVSILAVAAGLWKRGTRSTGRAVRGQAQ